jgi:uncharacterized protein involved in response to NO
MAIPRLRDYQGPALFSYGFRPFFLFGSLYAAFAVLAWLLVLNGQIELASAFAPRDWHVHEMLYGFVPAIVTGFLLTAIPNWTGRLPLQGFPLLTLLGAWIAGRAAVGLSDLTGWIAAAAIDGAFLLLVLAAAAREILAGKNWRNLKIVAIVSILAAGNVGFHLEAHYHGSADFSVRAGVAAVILLITLVGGRVVPSFTRNWLARARPGRMPAPFGGFDVGTVAASALSLLLWIAAPDATLAGAALIAAGLMQLARLARWAGERTLSDRLVLVLHIAYAFVPAGFVLTGCAALGFLPTTAGIHAWTGGAVGTMTLAVMTRASLGHTGRELYASAGTQAIYALVVAGAFARICASLEPDWSIQLLLISGLSWAGAFVGFALLYGPLLCKPRVGAAGRARRIA